MAAAFQGDVSWKAWTLMTSTCSAPTAMSDTSLIADVVTFLAAGKPPSRKK